ncbi:MAG: chorismate synthase [Bacillota bacterium]
MSSSFGERVRCSIFGQSHGEAIGVVIDGLPAGEPVDMDALNAGLRRRAPGGSPYATARREADVPEILSGIVDGLTCGAPLCAIIRNADARSRDYEALKKMPRPSHADYYALLQTDGHADLRGGGHFSGRLTAPLCIAGGIALQILARRGITVGAHIQAIAGIEDTPFDPVAVDAATLAAPAKAAFPVLEEQAGERMRAAIAQAASEQDSVGGIVECCAIGLPAGKLGYGMFGGLESRLSLALFGIPAVKGVEFGAGFAAANMRGSEHNDAFTVQDGRIVTKTNRHGGSLGGISTGMPLILRAAFKPTPSIARPQQSVDMDAMREAELTIAGRHDPCVVVRAVPVVEAVTAAVLLDLLLS